ncbi:MAG: hypothetical protein JSW62_02935 [Thermoplasmatales archaeon]|nr:MAG: hypothetical protein JSW62_02935 [Thermoplasmatales archaeon]
MIINLTRIIICSILAGLYSIIVAIAMLVGVISFKDADDPDINAFLRILWDKK